MTYSEMKKTIEKKYNDFLHDYAFFAFSNEQFEEGKKKLNVSPENKVVRINGGGFLLSSKVEDFKKLVKECDGIKKQYNKDLKQLKSALLYEMANHEYQYNEDLETVLEVLGIDKEEANRKTVKTIIKDTVKEYMNNVDKFYNDLENTLDGMK